MSEHKKNQVVADDQKASSLAPDAPATPAAETKKKIRKAPKAKKPKKKGVPIVVDILIVLLILGVIAGAIYGTFALGQYFATRYAEKDITYTMLLRDVQATYAYDAEGDLVITPDSDVYLTGEQGTHALGHVLSVSSEQNPDGTYDLYVTVRTQADYNYTLGYFVNQTKIAVGKSYTCRFSGLVSDALIVELRVQGEE